MSYSYFDLFELNQGTLELEFLKFQMHKLFISDIKLPLR
jgi:hypothetical protein